MKKDCIQSFWFFFEKRTAGQKSNGYFTFGKICNEVYRPNEERSFFMAFSTSKKDTSIRYPVRVSAIRYTAIAMKSGRLSTARENWYSMISGRLSAEAIRLQSRKVLNMQSGLSLN